MLVVTAAVPAERGAVLIKALQRVVDARIDEREAHYQSLLAGEHGAVVVAANAEPADAEPLGDPIAPQAVASRETNGSGTIATATDGLHEDDVVVALPIVTADDSGDVSAETERATGDVARDLPAEADDLPASLVFELSNPRQRYADALVDVAEHYLANGSSHRERRTGQRYEVVLTIGRDELAARRAAVDGSPLAEDVDPDWGVDEEDARQVACDADLTEFIQDAQGNLLNYERRRPHRPGAAAASALKLRDHDRCRFPGCPHQRYVEAHHIQHWIDGGETCPSGEPRAAVQRRIIGCCTTARSTSWSRTMTSSPSSAGTAKSSSPGDLRPQFEPDSMPEGGPRAAIRGNVSEETQLLGRGTLTATDKHPPMIPNPPLQAHRNHPSLQAHFSLDNANYRPDCPIRQAARSV